MVCLHDWIELGRCPNALTALWHCPCSLKNWGLRFFLSNGSCWTLHSQAQFVLHICRLCSSVILWCVTAHRKSYLDRSSKIWMMNMPMDLCCCYNGYHQIRAILHHKWHLPTLTSYLVSQFFFIWIHGPAATCLVPVPLCRPVQLISPAMGITKQSARCHTAKYCSLLNVSTFLVHIQYCQARPLLRLIPYNVLTSDMSIL